MVTMKHVLATALLLTPPLAPVLAAGSPTSLAAFVEQFDAPPGPNRWRWEIGQPSHLERCTHAQELGGCADGICRIGAVRVPATEAAGDRDWLCESMFTREQFGYGYFEARLAMAPAPGFNSAFWLRAPINSAGEFCEIDIVEGHYPDEVNTNIHTHLDDLRSAPERFHLGSTDADNSFHTYGLMFTTKLLAWYIDGKLVRSTDTPEVCRRDMRLRLSVAVLDWAGTVPEGISHAEMPVDYVLYVPEIDQ
jgi:hypothetical protein